MRKLALAAFVLVLCACCIAEENIAVEQLVSRHLASVGTPEARAAIHGRAIMGKCRFEAIQGSTGTAEGQAGVISNEHMVKFMTKLNSARFPDERFWFNGKKAIVPVISASSRSVLGDFLYRNEAILRDGIFTGALSTSWPLYDPARRGAKLKLDGLKTIEGRSLYQVTYVPKKAASELEIHLFFDPETFRHVETRYRYVVAPYMNVNPASRNDKTGVTNLQSETIYTVTEKYRDFSTVDGITLPSTWEITYTVEPVRVQMIRWTMTLDRPSTNPKVDPESVFPES